MPNTFAYLVLFSWPLVAVALFAAQPPGRALSLAVIVGFLLLPERTGIDLPMIPAIGKVLVINLTAAVVVFLALNRERQGRGSPATPSGTSRARWLFYALIALTVLTPFMTVLTNSEPVIAGPLYIQGIRLYDAVSLMVTAVITITPFMLGMRVLGTPSAQRELLQVLVLAGCAYAFLALYEVRMSPQLHVWVYGFFQHSFAQHIRDGFRPIVFLQHGLSLGIFLCMATLGACALARQALRDRVRPALWLVGILWLALTLMMSRNLGATVLMLLFSPVILFVPQRLQILIAALIAGTVLLYPMLRGAGLVPVDAIHDLALSINAERAQSLKFRLDNEDSLLARANEKPLAGWGSWGRNRIYDPETGRDLGVTDGIWVITIGTFGWLGYLAQFGLLAAPIILIFFTRLRAIFINPLLAGQAILMSVVMIDMIPNASLSPLTWMVAGALAGQAVLSTASAVETAPTDRADNSASWVSAGASGPLLRSKKPNDQSVTDIIKQPRRRTKRI